MCNYLAKFLQMCQLLDYADNKEIMLNLEMCGSLESALLSFNSLTVFTGIDSPWLDIINLFWMSCQKPSLLHSSFRIWVLLNFSWCVWVHRATRHLLHTCGRGVYMWGYPFCLSGELFGAHCAFQDLNLSNMPVSKWMPLENLDYLGFQDL